MTAPSTGEPIANLIFGAQPTTRRCLFGSQGGAQRRDSRHASTEMDRGAVAEQLKQREFSAFSTAIGAWTRFAQLR